MTRRDASLSPSILFELPGKAMIRSGRVSQEYDENWQIGANRINDQECANSPASWQSAALDCR